MNKYIALLWFFILSFLMRNIIFDEVYAETDTVIKYDSIILDYSSDARSHSTIFLFEDDSFIKRDYFFDREDNNKIQKGKFIEGHFSVINQKLLEIYELSLTLEEGMDRCRRDYKNDLSVRFGYKNKRKADNVIVSTGKCNKVIYEKLSELFDFKESLN